MENTIEYGKSLEQGEIDARFTASVEQIDALGGELKEDLALEPHRKEAGTMDQGRRFD